MKNKWMSFIKQNGFLIFLFICVLVVATGTILIATENLRVAKAPEGEDLVILEEIKEEEDENNIEVSKVDEPILEEADGVIQEEVADNLEKEPGEITEEAETLSENSEEDLAEAESIEVAKEDLGEPEEIEYLDDFEEKDEDLQIVSSNPKGLLPVEGKVITEFSSDKLVYSGTLDEWRAHTGIDIVASAGSKVKAPMGGVIKEVREDDLWGIIIVIDHENGYESRLSNLATTEMVKEGLKVSKGDVISTVGKTAKIEMAMEDHIHYEVYKNGKIIDPRSITN